MPCTGKTSNREMNGWGMNEWIKGETGVMGLSCRISWSEMVNQHQHRIPSPLVVNVTKVPLYWYWIFSSWKREVLKRRVPATHTQKMISNYRQIHQDIGCFAILKLRYWSPKFNTPPLLEIYFPLYICLEDIHSDFPKIKKHIFQKM